MEKKFKLFYTLFELAVNCPLEFGVDCPLELVMSKFDLVLTWPNRPKWIKLLPTKMCGSALIRVKKIKFRKRKEKNKTSTLSFSKLFDGNPWRFEASRLLEWSTLEWLWSITIQRSPWLLSFKIFIDENAMNLIWKKIKTMVGNTLDPPGLLESYLLRLWFTNLFSTVNS